MTLRLFLALIFSLMVLSPVQAETEPTSSGCGVERWPVKTGSDAGAKLVDLSHTAWTSPGRMGALPHPATLPQSTRIAPVETTQYRMTVTLDQYKVEADSDVHMVVSGTSGARMIVELPSPACVDASSPFSTRIAANRAAFDQQFHPSGTWQYSHATLRIFGVGFFDFLHNQTGAAPNAVELHPVTGFLTQ